jgi:hypothetical protein
MTTVADVKRVTRPLLQRNADLALVGRKLVLRPVRHVARFVLIDRCSSQDEFVPQWAVTHLFEPKRFLPLQFGQFLYPPGRKRWTRDEPDLVDRLTECVEQMALPELRARPLLEDYLAYCEEPPPGHSRPASNSFLFRRPILRAAMGDLVGALSDCELLEANSRNFLPFYREEFDRAVYELLPPLRAADRQAVAALLHAWEAFTVKANKLEHLWEPTPFPLEGLAP